MTAIAIPLAFLCSLGISAAAFAARSDWAVADQSQLRLLLAGREDGRLSGGVEMLIEPGWYTYWRNPGEAGIPPVFDFSASSNIAAVDLLFPAPERHDDGQSVSLIYRDEVVFPFLVTPLDPGEPVTLRVSATFGICSDICVPTGAMAELSAPAMPPPDPLAEARLAQFLTRVPKAAETDRFDIEAVSADGDALLIDVRAPDSSYLDLFSEAPPGWYIGQPEFLSRAGGISRYRLALTGAPENTALAGLTFRFVAVAGDEAIEKAIEFH
jgi:DsbC/DsbD-like thiol-disulfide interchange protein